MNTFDLELLDVPDEGSLPWRWPGSSGVSADCPTIMSWSVSSRLRVCRTSRADHGVCVCHRTAAWGP